MSYRTQISRLRADLAAIKADAPTARFALYDADEPDEFADVVSYGGISGIDMFRIPRELPIADWIEMVKREIVV
jgi:hypothetical protein